MCSVTLPQTSLCGACKAITFESLWKQEGYKHLYDIWRLEESGKSCHVCNLLQLLIRETAASTVKFEVDIPNLATALGALSTEIYKQGWILERPCPIILALYSSRSLGA